MHRYATYPAYKQSNIDRLNALPVHWNIAPLRRLLTEPVANGLFKKREFWGSGVKIVNVFDAYVKGDVVDESSLDRVNCDDSELKKYLVKHGDFVFVRSSLKLDGIGKSATILNPTGRLVFECHLVRGRPDTNQIDPTFLCYFLNSSYSRQSLVALSNQVTMATIDQEKFKSLSIAIPSISEQQTIARFLDFKTAQIDTLIAKKQTLLEKLAEKRTALISHAVTKGLDPSAAMKDSGVEWLAKIPAHWLPKRLRFCMSTNPSKSEIKLEDDELVSFIPMEAVGEFGGLKLETEKELGEISGGYTYFVNGDVLVAKITPCFENGKGAIARNLKNGLAFGTTELHVMRTGSALLPDYLFHLTMSYPFRKIGESEMYGAGGQKRVPEIFLKDFRIGLPPLNEQNEIVKYISNVNHKIDQQMLKTSEAINRLAEYRSALITNAVTGKIDVRNFPIPRSTAEEVSHA